MEEFGTKLTLQIGDTITTWVVPYQDVSLEQLFDAFQGLCVGQTFVPHSFYNECKNFYEERRCLYEEEKEDD